jgi:MFS family permease
MQWGVAMQELKANWGLLLAACICSSLVGIHYHILGMLIKPLGIAYGWSRGDTTVALTIASVLLPPVAIAVGWLGDRFGPRKIVLPGIILYGVAFSLLGLAGPSLWSWYALFSLYALVGFGGGIVLWSKAIVQKFDAQRGLALAICSSGVGILVAIIPTVILYFIASFGLRGTFFAWGACSVAIMLPVAWLFCPRDVRHAGTAEADLVVQRSSFKTTLRIPAFWWLAIAVLAIGVCNGPLVVQMQPMLTDSGMSPQLAARAAMVMGPALIASRLSVGFLFDRFPARTVAGFCFIAPALASLLLARLDGSFIVAVPAVTAAAAAHGAEVDVAAYLTGRYIGKHHYGFAFGTIIGLYGLGLSLGSTIAGYIHDLAHSNTYVLVMIAAVSVVAVSLIFKLEPTKRVASTAEV